MKALDLEIYLVVTTSLSIRRPPLLYNIDRETHKGSRGPVIPGPSLKGALRTAFIQAEAEKGLAYNWSKKPDRMDKTTMDAKLFGAPGIRGRIYVKDAEPIGSIYSYVKPGVEIDDYTGRAEEERLFFIEVIPPGSIFKTSIRIEAESCREILILLRALMLLEPVGLGSGAVRPFIGAVEVGGKGLDDPEKAAEQLTNILKCEEGNVIKQMLQELWLPHDLVFPLKPLNIVRDG